MTSGAAAYKLVSPWLLLLLVLPISVQTSCQREDDGGRWGYHAPGESKWLRDKSAGVAIEYYRVFQEPNGTAYMIPRPDGNPDLFAICSNPAHALRPTLDRYGLCNATPSPEVVNAMAPADALAIAHHLHEALVFIAEQGAVTPYVPPDDILALCNTDEVFRTTILAERCTFERAAAKSGSRTEQGWSFTPAQALQTAMRMNTRYGIKPLQVCDRLEHHAARTLAAAIAAQAAPCTTEADCEIIANASACHNACNAVVTKAGIENVSASRQRLTDGLCAQRTQTGCDPIIAPPCAPPRLAACVQGRCVQM